MLKRIYVNDIIKNKIYGSDKHMSKFLINHASGVYNFNCSKKMMEDYVNKTRKNLLNYCENKKDIFKSFDFENKKIIIRNDLTVNDILFECDEKIYDIINNQKLNKKMGIFFIYSFKKKHFALFFDHKIYDLSSAFKYFNLIYTNPFTELIKKIPRYTYKPIFNELLMMKSFKMTKFKARLPPVKNVYENNLCIKSYNTTELKEFKNKHELKSADLSLAISLDHIFKSLNKKINKLSIGILISLTNNRFSNNYTIIPLIVKRDSILNMTKNINKQKKKNILYSLIIYDSFNYYIPSLQSKLKKNNFDIFFSNVYTQNKEFDKYFLNCSFYVNSTCNFYITSGGSIYKDYNYLSFEYKTENINEKKFNTEIKVLI